jgi:hypothetical protein
MMRTPLEILLVLTSQATMGDELLNRVVPQSDRSEGAERMLATVLQRAAAAYARMAYKPPATIRRNWIQSDSILRTHCRDWLQSSYSGHLGAGTEGGAPGMGAPPPYAHWLELSRGAASSSHSD